MNNLLLKRFSRSALVSNGLLLGNGGEDGSACRLSNRLGSHQLMINTLCLWNFQSYPTMWPHSWWRPLPHMHCCNICEFPSDETYWFLYTLNFLFQFLSSIFSSFFQSVPWYTVNQSTSDRPICIGQTWSRQYLDILRCTFVSKPRNNLVNRL